MAAEVGGDVEEKGTHCPSPYPLTWLGGDWSLGGDTIELSLAGGGEI